ncbi:hypothetical protein I4U23_009829 [Adineta vaga]|nr:hypothetical protein I4U23_009829 [Adineta vaga]
MVHNCAILSCPLHNRRNIRKGLLFHSFPVDQHRFELWRQTVFNHCSQTLSINRHSKICYRHFQPDDYIANHTGLTRYLKATAIPSIFTETKFDSTLIDNNSILTSPTDMNMNQNIHSQTTASSSLLILPSTSSSSEVTSIVTDTKAKRLLNTIDKLHQIQNANKDMTTSNISLETEQMKIDEDDHHFSLDHSLQISQVFTIDHLDDLNKEYQSSTNTNEIFPQSSLESDSFRCPKSHLEDALFKFLEQANLLQYYSAFIEQGGDDLKQLAEAQNDDFQEIITLVGMTSKPLHIKRFKKALADYRQSINDIDINQSYTSSSLRCLSTGLSLSDRHSTSTNNSIKVNNQIISNWNTIDPNKNNNAHQLLDDSQRKMIADEAERLANLLPLTTMKRFNGQNNISKELFATMNLPRDFEDRWQRIRKYSAIYNRFDSKKSNEIMSLHEILINEAAAAICFYRPEYLTRRDELSHLARRILQNIGITTNSTLKRPLNMLTCDITPAKQVKLNMSLGKPTTRQRDPDTFRLMWHNREAKVEQIPIEIETLRCEQNKLLQQLKQNTMDSSSSSSSSIDTNNSLKKQIDELSKKIEQLSDEEKNLRRLIRKKNMRLRAKERHQQKQQMSETHSSTVQDLILPMTPPPPSSLLSFPDEFEQNQQSLLALTCESITNNTPHSINIKEEKIESSINLTSPVLKSRKDMSTCSTAKSIDRRREEVNDRAILINKKINATIDKSSCLIQRKQSSTMIQSVFNTDFHSEIRNDHLLTTENDDDIVDSKSFIHNLDFHITHLTENE